MTTDHTDHTDTPTDTDTPHPDHVLKVLTGAEVLELGRRLRDTTEPKGILGSYRLIYDKHAHAEDTLVGTDDAARVLRCLDDDQVSVSGAFQFRCSFVYVVHNVEFHRGRRRDHYIREIHKGLEGLSDNAIETVARLVRDALEIVKLPRRDADNEGGEG